MIITKPAKFSTLILRIVLLLIIPEIFILLCGLIFDMIMKLPSLTNAIFIAYVVVCVGCLALIILNIINYLKNKK